MEIHQLLPNLAYGDAISNYALELKDIFAKKGYVSDIYAGHIDSKMKKFCKPYRKHKKVSSTENIIIFHYSIDSEVSDYILETPDKKIMIYHNITPPHFFKNINDHLFFLTTEGRSKLKLFRDVPYFSIADSEFNALELKKLGFKNVSVMPVIVNFQKLNAPPNQSLLERYNNGYTNIIFVGRIVPNKRHEDIIKSFHFYKKYINPKSRLFLVGSYAGMEVYYNFLKKLVKELAIDDVIITGHVTENELISYYRLGDVFLCLSEHEGFCVPLLEAMHFNIPIIAYNSTGVPYTLKKAGILLNKKNHLEIAELIDLIINDTQLRNTVVKNQLRRLSDYKKEDFAETLMKHIATLNTEQLKSS